MVKTTKANPTKPKSTKAKPKNEKAKPRVSLKSKIKEVDEVFNQNFYSLVKKLGESTTNNVQLHKLGKKYFGDLWLGANSQDEVQLPKNKYSFQIINTDISSNPGIHWIGLFTSPKMAYVYDSYGRNTEKLLPILCKQLKREKLKYKESLRDAEQFGATSKICGQLSMAWLMVVFDYGIEAALLI